MNRGSQILALSGVSALLMVQVPGCGGDDKGAEADVDCQLVDGVREPDVQTSTAADLVAYEEVSADTWEARTIDTATCSDPDTGGTCAFEGQVIDFEDDEFKTVLGGTKVKVFLPNRIDDINVACETNLSAATTVCYEATADAAGRVSFPNIPCGEPFAVWAYKDNPVQPPTKAAVEFDQVVTPSSGIIDVLTISVATYQLIPGIVGFAPDATLGIVAGQFSDCAGNSLENATTHIAQGHLNASPASFCGEDTIHRVGTFYFVDNFPKKDQQTTSEDGLWAFANVPVGPVTVFAYGSQGGTYAELASVKLVSLPDTITIADLTLRD